MIRRRFDLFRAEPVVRASGALRLAAWLLAIRGEPGVPIHYVNARKAGSVNTPLSEYVPRKPRCGSFVCTSFMILLCKAGVVASPQDTYLRTPRTRQPYACPCALHRDNERCRMPYQISMYDQPMDDGYGQIAHPHMVVSHEVCIQYV